MPKPKRKCQSPKPATNLTPKQVNEIIGWLNSKFSNIKRRDLESFVARFCNANPGYSLGTVKQRAFVHLSNNPSIANHFSEKVQASKAKASAKKRRRKLN